MATYWCMGQCTTTKQQWPGSHSIFYNVFLHFNSIDIKYATEKFIRIQLHKRNSNSKTTASSMHLSITIWELL